MLQAADTAKAQRRPVLIYPEGTRVPHGRRPKLQAGFAGLYARLWQLGAYASPMPKSELPC